METMGPVETVVEHFEIRDYAEIPTGALRGVRREFRIRSFRRTEEQAQVEDDTGDWYRIVRPIPGTTEMLRDGEWTPVEEEYFPRKLTTNEVPFRDHW